MCHWILPESCHPIVKSTVYAMPLADFANTAKIQEMTEFDAIVRTKIGNRRTDAEVDGDFEGVFLSIPLSYSTISLMTQQNRSLLTGTYTVTRCLMLKIWLVSLAMHSMNI
jgi:hypothetical protein